MLIDDFLQNHELQVRAAQGPDPSPNAQKAEAGSRIGRVVEECVRGRVGHTAEATASTPRSPAREGEDSTQGRAAQDEQGPALQGGQSPDQAQPSEEEQDPEREANGCQSPEHGSGQGHAGTSNPLR